MALRVGQSLRLVGFFPNLLNLQVEWFRRIVRARKSPCHLATYLR